MPILVQASLGTKLFKVGITASSFLCQMTDEADGFCLSCHQGTHGELASSQRLPAKVQFSLLVVA